VADFFYVVRPDELFDASRLTPSALLAGPAIATTAARRCRRTGFLSVGSSNQNAVLSVSRRAFAKIIKRNWREITRTRRPGFAVFVLLSHHPNYSLGCLRDH